MKRTTFTSIFCLLIVMLGYSEYQPDILGSGFEKQTIDMTDDYEGKVTTTLVRTPQINTATSILYVHGYNDYFFQKEMANNLNHKGI